MKSSTVIVSLLGGLIPTALAQVSNPVYFPAYDPFTSAVSSGGSGYAAGQTLAGQTNALGSYWYEIGTGTSNANSLKVTGNTLSYLGLPAFSGNEIALTNAVGMGARMFVATNSSDASFIDGSGTNFFYSVVLQASNITSLASTVTTNYVMGMGDQGTISNQTSQPGTLGGVLYLMKTNSTNFVFGIGKQANQTTVWSSTVLSTNQTYFVVVDYEIVGGNLYGSPSGDNVRLWINPATNTFGVADRAHRRRGHQHRGHGRQPYALHFLRSDLRSRHELAEQPLHDVFPNGNQLGLGDGWTRHRLRTGGQHELFDRHLEFECQRPKQRHPQ